MKEHVWYIVESDELIVSNKDPLDVLVEMVAASCEGKDHPIKHSVHGNDESYAESKDGIRAYYIGEL